MDRVTDAAIQIGGTIAAIIAGVAALVNFAYETFETKEQSDQRILSIERRLERIEDKLDRVIEGAATRKRD